jgi:hypothetical protein
VEGRQETPQKSDGVTSKHEMGFDVELDGVTGVRWCGLTDGRAAGVASHGSTLSLVLLRAPAGPMVAGCLDVSEQRARGAVGQGRGCG